MGQETRCSGPFFTPITAILTVAACFFGGAIADADRGLRPSDGHSERLSATVLSSSEQVTVSWCVRSEGTARLRLYREQAWGREILVREVTTQPGMSSFNYIDENRPPGNTVYVLRVLSVDGSEKTLGSALCVESKFAPSDLSSVAGSYQPAWLQEISGFPDPRWFSNGERFGLLSQGFPPAPEPPVPRSY